MRISFRVILMFQVLYCSYSIHAQTTFNERFVVSELSLGGGISELNGSLNVIALGLNEGNFLTCSILLNSLGTVEESICYGYDEPFSSGLFISKEGLSEIEDLQICTGSFIFPDSISGGWYMIINELGNVEREKRYVSPMYSEELGSLSAVSVRYDSIFLEDSTVYLCYASAPNFEETQVDAGVICFDENDEMVWEKQWVTEDNEIPFAITYHEDYLFVSIMRNPNNLFVDGEISIYKLNPENGAVLEEWNEPWGFDLTELDELLSVEDGIVMVGSALQEPGELTDACILKINADGEELWHTIIENPDTTYRRFFTEVVQTTDGNYVAAGEWKYRLPEFDEENGNFNDDGWLVKFDAQTGAILWDRKYHYIEDTSDEHEIYDLTACADGGVAFVGEALDLTINNDPDYIYPVQQGWVVKVDEHGCVVPGCQENNVSELNSEKTYFKAGPNPLTQGQNLHIYLGSEATGTFILRDSQGKEIKSFPAHSKNTTYTWELDMSSGSYVLSLVDGNKVLQSEKIIKE